MGVGGTGSEVAAGRQRDVRLLERAAAELPGVQSGAGHVEVHVERPVGRHRHRQPDAREPLEHDLAAREEFEALLGVFEVGLARLHPLDERTVEADGLGARESGNAATYTTWIFLITALPIHVYILWRHGLKYMGYARKRLAVGTLGGLASMGSYGIALWAMTLAPIAVVAALRETSVIFGMLLAMWLLGERYTPLRGVSVLLVVGGAALLKLS